MEGRGLSLPGKGLSPLGRGLSLLGNGLSPLGRGVSPLGNGLSPLGSGLSPPGKGVSPSSQPRSLPGKGSPSDLRRRNLLESFSSPLGRASPLCRVRILSTMPPGFDVFLSHNSKDKPAVRELAEALRARGLKVWLDEWELVPGRPWQDALEEIIQTVRSAAVLVGKDGFGPWEVPEMRGCLSEFVDRKLPVIPVLLPGAPQKPKLPLFLKQFTWVDLRDGLTDARLDQLQWGITGKKRRPKPKKSASEPTEDPAFAAYRGWAAEQYRGLSLIGVGGGDVRMRFEEVYIPLRIAQRPERLERKDGDDKELALWLAEASRDLQVEEIFKAPHAAGRHALILGHPGSGKTTALLKLLHHCLTAGPESLGLAAGTRPVV